MPDLDPTDLHLPDGYAFTTAPERIDADRVHELLAAHAYWAVGRSRERHRAAMAGSRNYGVLAATGDLAAYARLVTDGATFGWLADVIVDPAHRGHGLGRAVVAGALADIESLGLKRVLLRASDQGRRIYERAGFTPVPEPDSWLQLRASTPATSSA
ncbi:GNAT family N-acetyltransferase [Isoptericola nanjingensis]|uniref:GNAT family N-acetyltransferase n=2 Tax=Promicromonosporaceae TaxID=85017 RepID=UPI0035EB369F|nr:GNAT family N-acetyltransferase [Isoptericola sp. QY 916]